MTQPANYIKCSTVKVSKEGIFELDRKKVVVSIFKSEIRSIQLQFGSRAERPLIQALVSLVLIGLGANFGIFPLFKFTHAVITNPGLNNQTSTSYVAAIIFLGAIWAPIGVALLISVFQKRHFLSIETKKGKRKVVFKDKIKKSEIVEFVEKTNKKYSYSIN